MKDFITAASLHLNMIRANIVNLLTVQQ